MFEYTEIKHHSGNYDFGPAWTIEGGPKSKFEPFYDHVTANLSGISKVEFRIGVNNIDSIYFTKRQKWNYSKYFSNS